MTLARRILSEKRRLIYPIVAALLLNAALFVAVVYPLSRRVATGERAAEAAARSMAAARREYVAAKATVSGKESADAELQKFYSAVLPPDLAGARRITFGRIDRLARDANLRPERSQISRETQRGSTLGKLTMSVRLSGEYQDIRRFIYELETAPEFLILETVALTHADSADNLDVTVQVSTYYREGGNGD